MRPKHVLMAVTVGLFATVVYAHPHTFYDTSVIRTQCLAAKSFCNTALTAAQAAGTAAAQKGDAAAAARAICIAPPFLYTPPLNPGDTYMAEGMALINEAGAILAEAGGWHGTADGLWTIAEIEYGLGMWNSAYHDYQDAKTKYYAAGNAYALADMKYDQALAKFQQALNYYVSLIES